MIAGISSYTYTWAVGVPGFKPSTPLDENGLIEKAYSLDVKCIQIADNLPLHVFGTKRLSRLIDRAQKENLRIEVGARGLTPDHLDTYIRIAAELKSPVLRFVAGTKDFRPGVDQLISTITDVISALEKYQITLCLENYEQFDTQDFVEIIKQINSPNVRICLDTVNSLGAGEGTSTVVEGLARYTANLHVKEFKVRRTNGMMGFMVTGECLGQGMMPLDMICRACKRTCQSAILEQWVPYQGTLESTLAIEEQWAKSSMSYLKKYLKSI